jgi:glucose/arabinose dehydrogenase
MRRSIPRGRGTAIAAALAILATLVVLAGGSPVAGAAGISAKSKRVGYFDSPVYVTGPRHSKGLLFVVERRGKVISVNRRGNRRKFLDIDKRVDSRYNEQGLLSIAFAPNYAKSRKFYVFYTERRHGDLVVAEFRRSRKKPRRALGKSRRTVIRIKHRMAPNHNGGQLQFGPGGDLYIGTGDGGGGGDPQDNAQSTGSLLGKLLRIDPRRRDGKPYTVPASNPFVGRDGRDEIYSYGLRNPWRFSFDRADGHLTIGDVGEARWEEIDYLPAAAANGANFGWDAYEGNAVFEGGLNGPRVDPIATFSHGNPDHFCAITGGYVYRGPKLRALRGRYVYSDYCRGQIRSLVPNASGATGDRSLGINGGGVSSFGEDAKGNLYYTDLNGGGVYKIVPKGGG